MKGFYMGLHISHPVRSILKHKINDYLFQYRIIFLDLQRDYVSDFLVDLNGMIEIDEFLLNPAIVVLSVNLISFMLSLL